MAKAKLLPFLTRRGSSLRSSSKKEAAISTSTSNESDRSKSQEELLLLLNNFPESELESNRELSFSFLLNNSLPENDDISGKGGKMEEVCKEGSVVKEKKKRRISRSSFSSSQMGVLLNFHVPVPLPDNSRSRSGRETPCTTLAEIEKKYILINELVDYKF
jgi:hypothetical protein